MVLVGNFFRPSYRAAYRTVGAIRETSSEGAFGGELSKLPCLPTTHRPRPVLDVELTFSAGVSLLKGAVRTRTLNLIVEWIAELVAVERVSIGLPRRSLGSRLTGHADNEKHPAQASNQARIEGPRMSVVGKHLPPNGSRVSCGRLVGSSQMEVYPNCQAPPASRACYAAHLVGYLSTTRTGRAGSCSPVA